MNPESSPSRGSTAILRVVLYYAGFSALWILLSDRLVMLVARGADQIAMLSTVKGWFYVGVTSLLLYRAMKRHLIPALTGERRARARLIVPPVAILGVVILALVWGGIHQVYRQLEATEAARLQAIADNKALQVSEWIQERRGDVTFASSSRFWSRAYYAWRKSGDPDERERLFGNLEAYRDLKGFQGLLVIDDQLTVHSFPAVRAPSPDLMEAVKATLADRASRVVGPYRDAAGVLHLDFLAPMAPAGDRPGPLLVLTVDPVVQLFPRLQAWPVPTTTGEAVLFRRKGDQVEYLSGSPQNPDRQIQMTRPMAGSELLTAQVLRGAAPQGAFVKGKDYNGEPVAGVIHAVKGTDWFLVAKIDQSELYAAARNQVAVIGLAGLLAMFLAVLVDRMFRQQRILAQAERDRGLQAERLRALRLLDGIATASSDAIYAKDRGGRYLLFNPEAERAFGMKAADVLGKEPYRPGASDEDSAILQRGSARTLEEVLDTPQGPRTFLVTKGPLRDTQGGIMGHYGIAKDITERKLAEQSLAAQNRLLERVASGEPIQELLDAITGTLERLAPGAMASILLTGGADGRLRFGSHAGLPEAFCKVLEGVPVAEGLGPCPTAAFRREPVIVEDIRTDDRFQGHFRTWMEEAGLRSVWSTPILDSSGNVLGSLGVYHREPGAPGPFDQSIMAMATHVAAIALEGHLEERALQESWLRFRQLFEAAPVPMCILGEGGLMVALNGQFTRTFGYTLDEIGSLSRWLERAYPDPVRREEARAWWAIRSAAGGGAPPVETTLACLDGQERTVLLSATAIGGEFLLTLSDITERVKAERDRQALQAEMQHSQKMESIGRLAGGVAHDFNNMLGVIVANAEVGLLHTPPGKSQDRFEEIKKAAMRSADLTRQLLAFARKQAVSPSVIDLNEAISGMLQMLSRLIGENITLDYTQRDGLWAIRMDPTQVDQILANLAVNARDAISGVGHMAIRTENRVLREGEPLPGHNARPGEFVVLEVSDTGCGMDAEVMGHIFEPFFTTKAIGKGTGLGLATVYGIVKQNDGFIEVRSAPGQGTTFRVHLPRHAGAAEKAAAPGADLPSPGGRECILVVEDEPMHLDVTVMLLGSLGYRTLAAASPSEALAFLGKPDQDIGLLLTDVIMPEMNGRELAERARKLRPELKCLLMSGYTADVMEHHGVVEGDLKVMGKPFTLEVLAERVRTALDA